MKKFDFNQEISGKRDRGKRRKNEGEQDSASASDMKKERKRKEERECACRSTHHHHSCPCPSHYLRHQRHGHNILHLNLPYWSCSGQSRDQHVPSRGPREFFLEKSLFGLFIFIFLFWIHRASALSTAGTSTGGCAVIRKPGSAWLKGSPAMDHSKNGKRIHM